MAKKIIQYSIFVSSPKDLEAERFELTNIIKELNLSYSERQSINLELIKWETHSAPGITENYTQDIINKDIGDNYDIFIGMLWQRFGTKTPTANSGTEEEFLRAMNRFKNGDKIQILFYFKTTPPISLEQINLEELSKINAFKEKLKKNKIFYSSFNSMEELQANLRIHIPRRIDDLIVLNNSDNKIKDFNESENLPKTSTESSTKALNLEEDYGIIDYIFQFEDCLTASNIAIVNISESTKIVGEDLIEKTKEVEKISQHTNRNKNAIIDYFKRLAKSLNSFSDRLELETPNFYNNFEDAINAGLKYLNLLDQDNILENYENIQDNYQSITELKKAIPTAIDGMKFLYEEIKKIPNIQSDLNKSKRRLIIKLEDLIFKLNKSYDLTNEFQGQLEYKLSAYNNNGINYK